MPELTDGTAPAAVWQAPRRTWRLKAILAGAGLAAVSLTAFLAFRGPADGPILLDGTVESQGQPIHLVLAEVTKTGTKLLSTSLVPTSDSFLFRVDRRTPGALVLTARSAGFEPTVVGTASNSSVRFAPASLKALPSPPQPTLAEKTVTVRTAPVVSGEGASFSAPYELCSDSQPGAIPEGFEIKGSEFRLEGDRSCGAWSTCQQSVSTPARACWAFRLQGHGECQRIQLGPFRAGSECNPKSISVGILTLHLVQKQANQNLSKEALTAYVQLDGSETMATGVCKQLESVGARCPGIAFGTFDGPSRVTYFNPEDQQTAITLAAKLKGQYGDLAVTQFRESGPVVRSTSSPRGQLELWLHARSGS